MADNAQVVKLIEGLAASQRTFTVVTHCVSLEHSDWSGWAPIWPSFNSWQGGQRMSSRGMWQKYLCHRSRNCIDKLCVRETCKRKCRQRAVAASFRMALSSELQSAPQAVSASAAGGAGWSLPSVNQMGRGKGQTHVVANRALKAPCLRLEGGMWLEVRPFGVLVLHGSRSVVWTLQGLFQSP